MLIRIVDRGLTRIADLNCSKFSDIPGENQRRDNDLKSDLASRKAAIPPSLSWKSTEKEFTEQVKDVKLFVKCIQAITLNLSPLLCGFASLREIQYRNSGNDLKSDLVSRKVGKTQS
jgi:hypothetical protein